MKITAFNAPTGDENIIALMSEKADGSMRMHGHAEYDAPAIDTRRKFLFKHSIDPKGVVSAGLVHGNNSEIVSNPRQENVFIEKTDALITDQRGVYLAITAADCSPVFLFDPVKQVIALVHSGWKGTLLAVVPRAIDRMVEDFNCSPTDIIAYIGPGIQQCHFEVGKDVVDRFPAQYVKTRDVQVPKTNQPAAGETHDIVKKYYVDLPEVIRFQLFGHGVSQITVDTMCAFCNKGIPVLQAEPVKSEITYRWFSFRREKSDPLKTQMAVFGMK